jgi:hypothetical protein
MTPVEKLRPQKDPKTLNDDKVDISNGTIIDIQIVIDDLASFNRYIVREHACKLQAPHSSGSNPSESCITNCIYDELSGWLDNPCLLGFSILGINVSKDKIKEEQVQLELKDDVFEVSTFELVKFIGELAGKDHEVERGASGSERKLQSIRQKARDLLKNLVRIG